MKAIYSKLALFLFTISSTAMAGMPDEDPIAAAYAQRFKDAKTPSFAQLLIAKTPGYSGKWMVCHRRSLARGEFGSDSLRYDFSKKTDEIIETYPYSSYSGREYFYNNGELQSIFNLALDADEPNNQQKKIASWGFDTVRVDSQGNLIIEYAAVRVPGFALIPYELTSTVAKTKKAQVVTYSVCRKEDML